MKLLLGVLLLLVAFAAAALWQRSWRAEAEAQREIARRGEDHSRASTPETGEKNWGRVIIGRPSGADPEQPVPTAAAPQIPAAPANDRSPATGTAAPHPVQPGPTPTIAPSSSETKVVVQHGDSLSSLCQAHYGTSKPDLVQAVALFNNLKDPDHLREGDSLSLPPLERLLHKNR